MQQKYKWHTSTNTGGLKLGPAALALLMLGLCTGTAQAQSSVTLYGTLDGGLRHLVNGTAAGGAVLTPASNGVFQPNRWGLYGVEDIGGGLNVHFRLESGFVLATGASDNTSGLIFHRNSTVGIGGGFGSVDVGHQFTMQHYLTADFEPFNFKYLTITEATAISDGNTGRDDNNIYYHGTFGPLTLRGEYALGGVAGSVNDGSTRAAGFNYHAGPFKFGAGYTHKANQLVTGVGAYLGNNQYTAGGAYSIGPVTAMIGYALNLQQTSFAQGATRNQYLWGGARYKISPSTEITAGYYDNKNTTQNVDGRKDVAIVGITYAISKATNFYADVDYTKFRGGYITNLALNPSGHASQTGFSFGMDHKF